ncbi:MAG: hypothetical protein PHQ62_00305 [Clostridia bacterium]|nr:hypothetical protein [Clostridia bacterium]
MTKFFSLVKVQLIQLLNVIAIKGSGKKSGKFLGMTLFVFGLLGVYFTFLYYQTGVALASGGMLNYLFVQVGITSVLFITMLITMEAQSHFFKTKDFEMLASMPLKSSTIVSAKLVAVLFSAYLYTAVTLIPGIVAYFILAGFSFGTFLLCILGFLLFPIIPTLIGTLIGLLFSFIYAKAKNPHLISFALILIFILLYSVFYAKFYDILTYFVNQGASFQTALYIVIPTVGFFLSGIVEGNFIFLLLNIAINLLALLAIIVFVSALYKKINFALNKSVARISKKELSYNQTSVLTNLIKTEAKRYFGVMVYMFNTIFMAIIGLILPFVIYFSSVDSLGFGSGNGVSLFLILLMLTTITMSGSNTASVSISMEGTKFENLKALPISPQKIIFAKIAFNVLLVLPFILLSGILNFILFGSEFTILTAIIFFAYPILAVVGCAMFGMLINLTFPKMKYQNYVQVVKQSASALIGLLGGVVLMVLPFVLYLSTLISYMSLELFLLLEFTYLSLFVVINFLALKKLGVKLFNKISC